MPLRAFKFADSAPAIRAALGFDADFFGTILATFLIIHSMFSDSDAVGPDRDRTHRARFDPQ
jgi:hypothetical protein